MPILKRKHINFYYKFFEKGTLPYFFTSEKIPNTNGENKTKTHPNNSITVINCVPTHVKNLSIHSSFGYFTKSYRKGYLMNLTHYSSSWDYLKSQLSHKTFRNYRQDIQRLKKNCDISFEILYGNKVDYNHFQMVFRKFEKLIKDRFTFIHKNHSGILRWSEYKENVFHMIKNNNASLMFLHHNSMPIAISLNYHYNDILDAAITSFDMGYKKYGIGKQMFYYQLEWAFKNNYRIIDLRWGDYEYKIKFANEVITYKTHVIYNKGRLIEKILSYYLILGLKWNYLLKKRFF